MKPSAIAHRLAAKYGNSEARRRALARVTRLRVRNDEGETYIGQPARWLLWTMVVAKLSGLTHGQWLMRFGSTRRALAA